MPNYVSPGVYVVEKDVSDYPPTLNSSVVGIVGFAEKGPIAGLDGNRATLITSQENLIKTFGRPTELVPGQGLEGALEILESTNQVYFVRVADASALEASASVRTGACPRVWINPSAGVDQYIGSYSPSTATGASSYSYAIGVSAYDNTGTKVFDSPHTDNVIYPTIASGATLAVKHENAIVSIGRILGNNKNLAVAKTAAFTTSGVFPLINIHAGSAAYLTVATYRLDNVTPAGWVGVSGLLTTSANTLEPIAGSLSATTTSGTTFLNVKYNVKSLYPGAGYNLSTLANGEIVGNSFEVDDNKENAFVTINDRGVAAESFTVNLNNKAFVETAIGTTVLTAKSEYVYGTLVSGVIDVTPDLVTANSFSSTLGDLIGGAGDSNGTSIANPRFIKLIEGTYSLAGGNSGFPLVGDAMDTAVIGSVRVDGGKTGIEALDDDTLDISIAIAPGVGFSESDAIQNALITKAESTQAFLAVVSPPFAEVTSVQDALNWHNGISTVRTTAINSSYASIYWPWVKVFSVADGKDIWMAPEIFAARQMAYTDAVSDPWFAPAGYVRGRLTKPLDTELQLNQGDRDALYGPGNAINPIVKFPQQGIVIFGQRTAQRTPSALDRVNIRRMMIVIRKMILAATRRLVFEPNDPITWARVEEILNPALDDIKLRRGITEFKVVCDNTTNTPVRVDRNEMWTKVIIKPTKTAEVIVFELNLTNQSASVS